jgi:hypothetical protein
VVIVVVVVVVAATTATTKTGIDDFFVGCDSALGYHCGGSLFFFDKMLKHTRTHAHTRVDIDDYLHILVRTRDTLSA